MTALIHRAVEIEVALQELGGAVQRVDASRWTVESHGSRVNLRAVDGWFSLAMPFSGDFTLPDLLGWNLTLPGAAKFALGPGGALEVRAEVPLDDAEALGFWLRESWHGFAAIGGGPGDVVEQSALAEEPPGMPTEELQRLCAEESWVGAPRDDGMLMVTLECPGAFHQASVSPERRGVRVHCELGRFLDPAAESVQSAALLLLGASRAIRFARPVMPFIAGELAPAFEVRFSGTPTAGQLTHALNALSIACLHCAEEVPGLFQNPDVAREYLALRARPSGRAGSATEKRKENP